MDSDYINFYFSNFANLGMDKMTEKPFSLLDNPRMTQAEERRISVRNLQFFLTFIGAVAYLQDQFYEEWTELDFLAEVKPGVHTTTCKRIWDVGGIKVEDEVVFPMDRNAYISGAVGHEFDFSTLIVYGFYDDPNPQQKNPKVGAFWTTEMEILKIPKDYHLENSKPRKI